tara:strand:- start:57 stop:548 length:492 start_codon:yes stop_codon:yes gene_type:complete
LKKLFLIRHAKSDWSTNLSDYYRPLNSRGLNDSPKMGKRIQILYGTPDIIISSGAKRALETAQLFSKELKYDSASIQINDLLYHASANTIIDNINKIDDKYNYAMLFSHNPGISHTVHRLTDHNVELKTACVALIEVNSNSWNDFKTGKCHLVNQFSPKDNLN